MPLISSTIEKTAFLSIAWKIFNASGTLLYISKLLPLSIWKLYKCFQHSQKSTNYFATITGHKYKNRIFYPGARVLAFHLCFRCQCWIVLKEYSRRFCCVSQVIPHTCRRWFEVFHILELSSPRRFAKCVCVFSWMALCSAFPLFKSAHKRRLLATSLRLFARSHKGALSLRTLRTFNRYLYKLWLQTTLYNLQYWRQSLSPLATLSPCSLAQAQNLCYDRLAGKPSIHGDKYWFFNVL